MYVIRGLWHHVVKLVCGPHSIKLFSKETSNIVWFTTWEELRASHLMTMPAGSKLPEILSIYLIYNLLVKNFQWFHIVHTQTKFFFCSHNWLYAIRAASVSSLSCPLYYSSTVISDFSLVPFHILNSPTSKFLLILIPINGMQFIPFHLISIKFLFISLTKCNHPSFYGFPRIYISVSYFPN